ncbi:MAG: prolyl oligopeptidase family serine peptidase [Gemmatimonadetes bacterium]|nr:prolyl oligopeptidase family serine peptidase [Gemmatimonadota bacterium]
MERRTVFVPVLALAAVALGTLALGALTASPAQAQRFSIADVLSPGYPVQLVAAKDADRIAWIEYEEGRRNVYTATAPGFEPVRLTRYEDDDGRDLSNLRISDDGSTLVFLRGHTPNREGWIANPASDPRGAERAVWAVSTAGGEPWRVVEAWNVALSPDGEWVAYAKDGAIYRAPVNPGVVTTEPERPLFSVFGSQGSPVWSPDSRRIAFVSDREDHSFIGVYDTDNPGITYLGPAVDRDTSPTWSSDGTRVAFIRRPGLPFGARADLGEASPDDLPDGMTEARFAGGYDFSIWVGDVRTGEGREVWHNAPDDEIHREVRSVIWAGDHIIFQAEPDGWRRYYSVAAAGGTTSSAELTPGDGIAEYISLSPDGRTLFYATNAGDIDRRHLWRVPTAGGEARQLTHGDGIETYPAALASGDEVAVLYADARQPLTVAVVPADGGEARTIRELPARYPLDQHVVPEAVTLEAEDGYEFYNQLFLPPDLQPGERRPAMIFIHGGSRRQMLLGYHYMHFYHMAYAMNQYFANKGYVVLSVNYRSGIGYGREFRNAPGRGRLGNTEYRDIKAAGEYLRDRGDVDAARIGLWGLSYGGILTAQGLARDSDLFAAGVDIAGVHLWGNSIDPETVSYQSSSVAEVENWTSPVLLIHGDDDRNVAFSQTVGLVQLLRAQGVPHELIVFPDDVHDFLLHERWLITFDATDDFFDRYMGGDGAVATEGRR